MSAIAIDDDAVLWSAPAAERAGRPLLLLLHGYGSDERDLFGLVPFLPDAYVFAAVRAPLSPPFPAPGWSWYPIEGLDGRSSGAVTDAAEALIAWVEAATDAETIGILGFSQGAAVALQALRLRPERFAFAVNLAGYVDPSPLPADARLAERRPPVFWGRGARDEVIPPAAVAHTVQWLPEHVELSGRVYKGLTHSVSQEELDDVRVFLQKRLDDVAAGRPGEGAAG
ncbi:dienelactone hydrolase family protein [Microbacterium hominis]|uniref:alpha/beta hydrolase n=1 Tax=Microbacterium TaxID=33882 RepID=UPI00168B7C78|nr:MULTISPECIES: alpha/beta fold hydrolase [Microbacterium]QOC26493.1 dienelactone hydrolase family protein [Microbacterium hominis]QOC27669.1 dienelactone hydrolase family protein [Microbacterium hominis]QYF97199.1 dienelactone hydrolase family protein [Microbacterium sp. PAMC21962]